MDTDKNLDQDSKSPDSNYKTPHQTPSPESATPVPRRFVDFTLSSSDDSTLSNTPLDPKLSEQLLGSDSSGKSLNESVNNTYYTRLSSEKGSGTESTLALSPLLNETSNTADVSLTYKSEDDLNEAKLFEISVEKVLPYFSKGAIKSQTTVGQRVDSVDDTLLRREDEYESRAPYIHSKGEILDTDLENTVLTKEQPSDGPMGILGSLKELSETLPSRVELAKKSSFETPMGVSKSFFGKPVVETTYFRDLDGPNRNQEFPSLVISGEGGSGNGSRTDVSAENVSSEVNEEMSPSPSRNFFKADGSKIDGVRKILKDFFGFSKLKESSEKKRKDSKPMQTKRSGTEAGFGSEGSRSKKPCTGTSHNWSQESTSLHTFRDSGRISESFSAVITDNSSIDRETEPLLKNTPVSNYEMETQDEKTNETSGSPRRNIFPKLDAELAMDLDRDLILFDSDKGSNPKESYSGQIESPETPKITLPQNLATSNIFALSFNADDLRKEQKLKEDEEKKMLACIQELKSKRYENIYQNNEPSYTKLLTEIKKEPIYEETSEPELKESCSYLEPANTEKPEGCKRSDFEVSHDLLCPSSCEKLKENFIKYANLKTEQSFKVQELNKTDVTCATYGANDEPDLCKSKQTEAFSFSDPIVTCMDHIKDRLCSKEEGKIESPTKNSERDDVPSLKSIKKPRELQMDDSYSKHTCEKYYNLSPRKAVDSRFKKSPQENTKAVEFEIDTCPMDVLHSVEAYEGGDSIQFDKSVAKGVMRALRDMNSAKGVLLTQIKRFVVQQRLVRIDSKVDKEVERFMDTAVELGIVTKKGARFIPLIKAAKGPKSKKVETVKKEVVLKQKPGKKVGVKVSTPCSRRLEKYRQKVMNSPVPLLSLRTRRILSEESTKGLRASNVFKSLRSRVIMVDANSEEMP